jgi:glycosyltransferase involved in cell wall biosynthesis
MSDVSVVIPCRNAAGTLAATLRSLVSEADLIHEVLVVDAASSDSSRRLATELGRVLRLPVRIIETAPGCAGATRNAGLDHASGSWVYFIDADDEHAPGGLRGLLAALEGKPEAKVAVGPFIRSTIGVKQRQKSPRGYGSSGLANAALYLRGKIPSIGVGSALVERTAVGDLRFPIDLPYDEDTLFWAAMLARYPVAISDALTFVYHVDTRRADDRFTGTPRRAFLAWRASLRTLTRHGIDGNAIRMREGIVALKVARVHYARGLYSMAAEFLRVAEAAPQTLGGRWRAFRYRFKIRAALSAASAPDAPRWRRGFARVGATRS